MRKVRLIEIAVVCFVVLLVVVFAVATIQYNARNGMGPTACQFSHIGLAIKGYSQDYDGRYPWNAGSSKPAWTFLGMLYPEYVSAEELFVYKGCRDYKIKAMSLDPDTPGQPFADTDLISFSYGIDARDPAHPTSWTENAPSTTLLLADKKAGIPLPSGSEARRISHWGNGRKVLRNDGSYKWMPGLKGAVDPDPYDDEIGAPDATDYRPWWSDPLYWFEWQNIRKEARR